MRVIKFRAWDKHHKNWATCELKARADFSWSFQNPPKGKRVDRSDWQQFTGFKDKDGKEIYEGDIIINVYFGKGHPDHSQKVYWNKESGCWDYEGIFGKQTRLNNGELPDWSGMQVIGNIYENPGLLK